jgi:thiol reductant ABC exporter CydC subunit
MFSSLPGINLFKEVSSKLWLSIILGAGALLASISLLATSGWLISAASLMPPVLTLSVAVVAVRTFGISRSVLRYFERLISHSAAFTALISVRSSLYENLARVAPAGLLNYRRGDLLARAVADVDRLADYPLRVYLPIGAGVIAAVFSSLAAAFILPIAGLILAIALFGAAGLATLTSIRAAKQRSELSATHFGDYTAQLTAATEGIADLVALNNQQQVLAALAQTNNQLRVAQLNTVRNGALAGSILTMFQGLAVVASLWAGAHAVATNAMDGRNLAVLVLLPLAAFESVIAIPGAIVLSRNLRESLDRIEQLISQPNVVVDSVNPTAVSSGPIALDDAAFLWSDGRGVQNVDLELHGNEVVGLIGPSGVGKTSIANGLIRFIDLRSGSYTKNDVSVTELASDEIRAQIIYLEANQHLFTTSVAANLRIAKPFASDEELLEVLARVDMTQWLAMQSDGLETQIGQNGAPISGGQRQRILLARLLLAQPEFAILDEPTEYLDDATAERVLTELLQTDSGKLLISHRTRDLRQAHRVVELTSGNTAN